MKKPILVAAGSVVIAVVVVMIAGRIIAGCWGRRAVNEQVAGAAGAGPGVKAKTPEARSRELVSRMKNLAPRGTYLLIDTAENRLRVVRDGKILQEAVVSCGSGDILQDPSGERKWIFDTPRGEFTVNSKLVNPTWIKPDWAFYEEGEAPPKNYNERIDNDTLGDYALGIGDGYFIHGTLYTRLLGRNVTHGCVRVGDKDLKTIFLATPMGAKVYIY
ncbi:MAG: L,D-transpeptidase [Candidatus Aminicenantes bacterium]|nr:L,D-transpeptidase [Candidatus Aminicenantes bacterium]